MVRLIRPTYLSDADERRVIDAIGDAERGSQGEVRVHLEARYPGDGPLARAAQLFVELGMAATQAGTGVLLYAAVEDRKAAVWAGPGVFGATVPSFWREAIDQVSAGFRAGRAGDGLVGALTVIGDLLRRHAVAEDVAGNELPDRVTQS